MMFFGVFITTDDMCLVQTALPAPRPMNERRAACQLQSHSCSFREHRKCGAGYNFALDAEGPYMCYVVFSKKSHSPLRLLRERGVVAHGLQLLLNVFQTEAKAKIDSGH